MVDLTSIQIRTRMALTAWLTLSMFCSIGLGQDEPSPTPADMPSALKLPDVLRDGTLAPKSRLYLLNAQGNRVLVPDETLENFLLRQQRSSMAMPEFVLDQSEIHVVVEGHVAKVEAVFRGSLTNPESSGALVPLYLESCQLNQQPETTPAGASWIQCGEHGYRWLIKGGGGGNHSATLKGEVIIANVNERHELRLPLPFARTQIHVRLPANAVDEVVRGQGYEHVKGAQPGQPADLTITGRGGETTVTWRDADEARSISTVEATSTTRMQVDDVKQPWKFSTDITLRWNGEDANDKIVLQLPAGAKITRLPTSPSERFEISPVTDNGTAQADAKTEVQAATIKPQVIVRNLDPSPMQPIDVRLDWEWLPQKSADDMAFQPVDLTGVDIQGVDVHTGTLDILAPGNYVVTWRTGTATQFVQQETFDRNTLSFRFTRQPLELAVSLRPQSNVALIRPVYAAHIDANKVRLTAWLDCSFNDSLGTPQSISIRAKDWNIESAELVPGSSPLENGEPLMVVPQADGAIAVGNPASGTSVGPRQLWRIVSYRWLDGKKDANLNIELPELKQTGASSGEDYDHGSGVLFVTCDENMLLKWRPTTSVGLLIDSLVPQWQIFLQPEERRNPLVFRFQSQHEAPVWSGSAEPLAQQIALQQRATVNVDDGLIRINQMFQLQIANEPLSQIQIAVRNDALQQDPQVLLDGTPLSLRANQVALDANSTRPESEWKYFDLITPDRLRGNVSLSIRTSLAWSAGKPLESLTVNVPLAQVVTATPIRAQDQSWTVQSIHDIEAIASEDVKPDEASVVGARPITIGAVTRPLRSGQSEIGMNLRKLESVVARPIRVNKSWLQTIFNGDERRDRYCLQVETTLPRISIRIPNGRDLKYITINGERMADLPAFFSESGTLIQLDLPKNDRRFHQVEVWMSSSESLGWATSLSVAVPEVENAEFFDRFFWQLVVPGVQHMGLGSVDMTPEWSWNWGGFWWQRQSRFRQADLERWVGATQQTDLPASVNSYVLSSISGEPQIRVWVISRFILWLPTGLLAVLLSATLVAVRRFRHPAFLLVLAGLIASAATVSPDLAMLIGQTALASLGLVALVLLTQAAVESRVRKRSVFGVRPASIAERSDHFSVDRVMKAAPPSSTQGEAVVAQGRP